jgi:hypothetical protein
MTAEKKSFLIELTKSVTMVVVSGVIMGFIMRPSSNKDAIQELKSTIQVEKSESLNIKEKVAGHDTRILELEKTLKGVATTEQLQILKEDLIRELKK